MTTEYNPLNHSVVQALQSTWQRFEASQFVAALIREIKAELETAYWNVKQQNFEDRKEREFLEIPGFAFRDFTYDCDCGSEAPLHAPDCPALTEFMSWNERRIAWCTVPPKEPTTRAEMEDASARGRGAAFVWENVHRFASELRFEREDEFVKSYPPPPCACGASKRWIPGQAHSLKCAVVLPNMQYGEVAIQWYKHIGRGMSVSVDFSPAAWNAWFDTVLSQIDSWEQRHRSER